MDVAESPERDPRSPEDEEEEQQRLSDDDILRESGSDQDFGGAGGRGSDLEDEDHAAPGLSQEEEESHSDEEDQDPSRGPASPPRGEEERASDLRDEASSVTRDLDEHELDYDEEVPEEPAPAGQEDEAEKAGAEDDEEKGDGAPGDEGAAGAHCLEDKEPLETSKEKSKEDDDGELDDGELDDDDLEEGEVKDPSDRKVRPRPPCRFFMKGNCTWGMNCRFIHPGVNDKGNYSLITKAEPFPPNGAPPLGPHPLMPANPWGGPVVDEILPPPPPEPPTESAWERGLRHAKEVLKKATIRKEQEPDFEEKRFTVTIGEDEREFDKENEVFRDWNYRITRDVRETALEPYADPYYDYEIERFWRGGQYENFRVQYTETEPYHNYRVNRNRNSGHTKEWTVKKERKELEITQKKNTSEGGSEWSGTRVPEREGAHSMPPPELRASSRGQTRDREGRQTEPPKKEATAAGPQVKRADEWKDPWRRSKSPKKKLGVSVSPSRARRRRKTSASSASPGDGHPQQARRQLSFSRVPRGPAGSDPPPVSCHREKSMKKPAPPPAPPQAPKTTPPAPEPAKPGDPREARRRERPARTNGLLGTLLEISASVVPEPRDLPALDFPASALGGPAAPQQAPPGQPQQGSFVAHKEIKLTLLNKAADKGSRKRYEPSDKDRQSPPPAKRANLSPDR
uniref:Zinc finger CCCH-type containing 18 n=1 Tax=Panthera tigris altaica TaxID=74533 RepID=A0A8C9JDP3_PANTA